jgi:hypothetical protein
MKITGIKCPSCNDIVFSRARHDCRFCSCGDVYIDGGFDYTRIGFSSQPPEKIELNLDVTVQDLFFDWANCKDEYGLIKDESN